MFGRRVASAREEEEQEGGGRVVSDSLFFAVVLLKDGLVSATSATTYFCEKCCGLPAVKRWINYYLLEYFPSGGVILPRITCVRVE